MAIYINPQKSDPNKKEEKTPEVSSFTTMCLGMDVQAVVKSGDKTKDSKIIYVGK